MIISPAGKVYPTAEESLAPPHSGVRLVLKATGIRQLAALADTFLTLGGGERDSCTLPLPPCAAFPSRLGTGTTRLQASLALSVCRLHSNHRPKKRKSTCHYHADLPECRRLSAVVDPLHRPGRQLCSHPTLWVTLARGLHWSSWY